MTKRIKGNGLAKWVAIGIMLLSAAIAVGGMIQTLRTHGTRLDKDDVEDHEVEELAEETEGRVDVVDRDIYYIQQDIEEIKGGIDKLVGWHEDP